MWARVVEVMLGVWLAMSPFVFRESVTTAWTWANHYICATLIITFSLLSYISRLEKIHLLNLLVSGWLIFLAFRRPDPPPEPAYQNFVVVGLLVMMFAIIPSRTSAPPRRWQEFYGKRPSDWQ